MQNKLSTKLMATLILALFMGSSFSAYSQATENKSKNNAEQASSADEYGETNPEELSMKYYIKNMNRNLSRGHDFVCSLGYLATKAGDHKDAIKIFKTCAKHGNQASKVWMSYMHQNGFGVKKDAQKSTEWVKDAADEGYSIGKYNYGLALLKGYGVKRDKEAGKAIIDEVAADGDIHAKELKESNYNPDVVTPDADQADKAPLF
ncbi:MAG: tetratricopeptide repeat protein [Rhodomicrobiaceae bacterium]